MGTNSGDRGKRFNPNSNAFLPDRVAKALKEIQNKRPRVTKTFTSGLTKRNKSHG